MMDERLADLYRIPEHVRAIVSRLLRKQKQTIEAYLDTRDELEFQSVKVAMQFGKHLK